MNKSGTIRISRDRVQAFEQGYTLGQVAVYCESVRNGAKLAAECSFPTTLLRCVRRAIRDEGLICVVAEQGDGRTSIWIVQSAVIGRILREHWGRVDRAPSALDIWVTGKLLGYGDENIQSYIQQHTAT